MLVRHGGEGLQALQHIVATSVSQAARRRQAHRSSTHSASARSKDVELRQMAKLLAEKAKQSGVSQQLGPLNPYERRIVHMAVAEILA